MKRARVIPLLCGFLLKGLLSSGVAMDKEQTRVYCETPAKGKKGTHIVQWKYDLVRSFLLKRIPKTKEGIEFQGLADTIGKALSASEKSELGSVAWYTTTVKLDLEVKQEIERIAGSKPQRLRRRK